jgi:ribosomal protein S27E
MESQILPEDIVIGKNGSHISVQCPGCNMPATLSYDFLAKVLNLQTKEDAKAWVKAQVAAGRPNPVPKSKKGVQQTFPEQTISSPDIDPIYNNAYGDTTMIEDSCPLPSNNLNTPINTQINGPNLGTGTFESIDVDKILEQTPMDVLKNSYRGFRLQADVVRDLDRYFDLHYPEGMISPTEAQAGFSQFPKIPKSVQPQLAMEYQRNLQTWEIERKKASALYDGINLRNTKPNFGTGFGYNAPGALYPNPVPNPIPYTPEQQNILMQSQTDPNFQYRVQMDPHLQQIWAQIQQIQQMQQQQMMQQQQQMMYQRPQMQSPGMNEDSILRILRQERERTRMEMQQMLQQVTPRTQEKGTADVLLVLLTEMMKNNGNQQQSAQQMLHQQQLEQLKNEINNLKMASSKERDPLMDTIMSKMVDQSLGQGPNQMNAILQEIEELKKKGNLSSSGIQSSNDFHNFIELQKVMAEISDKKSSIEERKENREMIKSLVTEGIGQVAGVVGAIITGKSGMPPAQSPGQAPAMQQEVGAMVTEHTVTIPCMYCQKTITFPRGVETVECPFCHSVMGVPGDIESGDELYDSSDSDESSSEGEENALERDLRPIVTPEVPLERGANGVNTTPVVETKPQTSSDFIRVPLPPLKVTPKVTPEPTPTITSNASSAESVITPSTSDYTPGPGEQSTFTQVTPEVTPEVIPEVTTEVATEVTAEVAPVKKTSRKKKVKAEAPTP